MSSNETSNGAITRRAVLAAGLAPMIVPRHVLGGPNYMAPSDKLTIAAVGVGGMGRNYLDGCQAENIVALCDLDWTRPTTQGVFQKFPTAARYRDFRQMFDKEEKNFDALIIAVPDHWHAYMLMQGIQMKKHMYCAKPVAHSIGEVRKVRQALLANPKLITKASIQDSRTSYARASTELLLTGVIGPVREVHIWSSHPIYPCNVLRPSETQTPPEGMDWDLWVGPARFHPYNQAYHPEIWRAWFDFGTADVGDMACHTFQYFFEELQLHAPKVIYGYSSTRTDVYNTPVVTAETEGYANTVVWEYGARGNMPPLNMYFYDGGMRPPRPVELDHATAMPRDAVMFVGDKGKMLSGYYGGNPFQSFGRAPAPGTKVRGLAGGLLLPEDKFKDFQQPAPTLPRVEKADHYTEWTSCAKAGKPTCLPIPLASHFTETALLGTLALRTRKVLEWDIASMRVTNADESVNQFVEPAYRAPWKLPTV